MRSKLGILAAVVCSGCAIDLAPEDGQPGNAGVPALVIQKCKVPLTGVDTLLSRSRCEKGVIARRPSLGQKRVHPIVQRVLLD